MAMKTRLSVLRRVILSLLLGGTAFLLALGGHVDMQSLVPGAIDSDEDGLPDLVESRLGTNPLNPDTDGDRLLDGWEVAGIVPSLHRSGANAQPVEIAAADPLRPDIYVEVDWMRDATHTHQFRRAAIDRVEDAFTRAPVNNASGESGVNIHIDTGQLGGGGDEIEHLPILPIGTGYLQVAGLGWEGQGAAIAIGNIDGNAAPDAVLMAYDNPAQANSFRYIIAWNLNRDGNPMTWSGAPNTPYSSMVQVAGVGWEGQGAGARLIDLDGNSRPELILMAYDNPAQANSFRYRIGWNLDNGGVATSWSDYVQ